MSIKISFQSMVYEDALTILSYASPYDVEVEVQSGGVSTKPTTLLKKATNTKATRICHPLFRSQSIPELSSSRRTTSKYCNNGDLNDSNYSTMNSTIKSSKSTPGVQTLERRYENAKSSQSQQPHHFKFGIKVLPALDGTIHRIENQNEHNTNLERRNSKKNVTTVQEKYVKLKDESYLSQNGIDVTDKAVVFRPIKQETNIDMTPKGVPEEVSSSEPKSAQKNKRKAPLPPSTGAEDQKTEDKPAKNRHHSDSDTDNELQHSFTTIELDAAQITIHHTPVSEMENEKDEACRKVSSLGDLSKFKIEVASALFERAKSLDMNDVGGFKKRKLSSQSEKTTELADDAADVPQIEKKLKKSTDWGNLEDVIWSSEDIETDKKSTTDFIEAERTQHSVFLNNNIEEVEKALSDFEATLNFEEEDLYAGKQQVTEKPVTKLVVNFTCPGCQLRHNGSQHDCEHSQSMDSEPKDGESVGTSITINDMPQKPQLLGPITVSSIQIGAASESSAESSPKKQEELSVEKPNNYVTEIKVFNNNDDMATSKLDTDKKQVITIREKSDPMANSLATGSKTPLNDKPPVPPRRSDVPKYVKGEKSSERQIVYISEYKTRVPKQAPEVREEKIKDFKSWVFENDNN